MPSYIESPSDPEEGFYVTLAQTITTDSIEPHLEIGIHCLFSSPRDFISLCVFILFFTETQPMADDSIESHLDNGNYCSSFLPNAIKLLTCLVAKLLIINLGRDS